MPPSLALHPDAARVRNGDPPHLGHEGEVAEELDEAAHQAALAG